MNNGDDPLVFVERSFFEGRHVITVYHENDGDWQYLTTENPRQEDAQMVHQSHVYRTDPSLRQLESMPLGTWASRSDPEEPWEFGADEA